MSYKAIDRLIKASLATEYNKLEWISYSEITDIKPSQIGNIHYAVRKRMSDDGTIREEIIILILVGSNETCTTTLVSEFARIYSLPTFKYNVYSSQFRRYNRWLFNRNELIIGFTEYDNNYYMVACKLFYHCHSLYGFCSACGILRCSPVWCICGHKQLSNGWTSNNKQLVEFIKNSQLQTNSANDPYLEWIPFDCIGHGGGGRKSLVGPPFCDYFATVKLIPLEITDELDDSYYDKVNYSIVY